MNMRRTFHLRALNYRQIYMLMNEPYLVPEEVATGIAPVFADAMLAHFGGDESISAETKCKNSGNQ